MKTRLLGAAVIIALAVLFVPMFFSSNPPSTAGDQAITSLDIPPAPDRDLQTRTLNLEPGAAPGAAAAPSQAAAPSAQQPAAAPPPAPGTPMIPGPNSPKPASNDGLATVSIGSNRPRDVETDPAAGKKPEPTTVQQPGRAAASEPVIAPPSRARPEPAKAEPAPSVTPPAGATQPTAEAAHGSYSLNLSAYASAASAQNLTAKVRALGYPTSSRAINQGGKSLTMVSAGPFGSRAAAEAARLKITQAVAGVPARLESGASSQAGDAAAPHAAAVSAAATPAPATPIKPAPRAGGWAVQVAAVGNSADATALRDKLRGAGFDGFVDAVNAGGKQLFRVRAGPQTQRDDALRLKTQIQSKLGLNGNVVSMP